MERTIAESDPTHADSAHGVRTWLVRVGSAATPTSPPRVIPLDELERVVIGRVQDEASASNEVRIEESDRWMSASHAEVARTAEGWRLSDLGSSNGTLTWGRRASTTLLADGDMFEAGSTFFLFRSRTSDLPPSPDTVDDGALDTVSPRMRHLVERTVKVARSPLPVVITGPTGSGKEHLALELHRLSGRTGPFVPLDVGTLVPGQAAPELFGVADGVADLRPRPGRLRSANGGTVLVDQLGDMSPEVQVALLRVLQDGQVTPVGEDQPIKVDLRFVCTTHEDIQALVDAGRFRADLWSRLKAFGLSLPPLVERLEDLGLLIGRFLTELGTANVSFSPAAYRALLAYAWPHNVRELQQCVASAVTLSNGDRIESADLPEEVQSHRVQRATERSSEETRERELVRLLAAHRGNVSAVARSMGYSRMQVHRWMKQMNVDPNQFRS